MDEKKLYADALETGGIDLQFHMAIEEALELGLAILRLYRKRGEIKEVAEEIADVEILCEQLRTMIGDSLIDKIKKEKQQRLQIRIKSNTMVNQNGDTAGF